MIPAPSPLTLYSVIIPARDEEESLPGTLRDIHRVFSREGVPHEIVVVDDGSRDNTWGVLDSLRQEIPVLAPVRNPGPHGFSEIFYAFTSAAAMKPLGK